MSDQQEAMARFEMLQQALSQVDGQLARIEQQVMELQQARATLDGLSEAGDQPALIPIGGGLHIRAHLVPDAPVVNPIGRSYAADMDVDAARQALTERIEEAEKLMRQKTQEAETLASQARQLAQQLQQ